MKIFFKIVIVAKKAPEGKNKLQIYNFTNLQNKTFDTNILNSSLFVFEQGFGKKKFNVCGYQFQEYSKMIGLQTQPVTQN